MTVNIDQSRAAQDLIARLARQLSSELDLHNETIDHGTMYQDLEVLRQAVQFLNEAGLPAPEVTQHILRRAAEESS